MSKLMAVVLTAAITLPLGALLHGQASAERRRSSVPRAIAKDGRMEVLIPGHRHLARAYDALYEALDALEASQRANEGVWSDTTGRASAMKESVEQAARTVDGTATWVMRGLFASDSRVQ